MEVELLLRRHGRGRDLEDWHDGEAKPALGEINLRGSTVRASSSAPRPNVIEIVDAANRTYRLQAERPDEANSWLARGPSGQPLMRRRQELPEAALLSPDEAIALFNRADRSVLALSYRWLTAAHPDPRGSTLAAVRRYLRSDERLASCGLFWDVRTAAAPVRLPARHARVPGAQALVPIALPLTWRAPCASLCAAIRRPSHHRIATFRPAPAAAVCVRVPKGRERRAHGLRDGLL